LDIYNGTYVVSSLLYDTSGVWRAGGQRIYTDDYHPLADSVTNALSLGGYSASSYPRKAENAVITGAWEFRGSHEKMLHLVSPDLYGNEIVFTRETVGAGNTILGRIRWNNYNTGDPFVGLVASTDGNNTNSALRLYTSKNNNYSEVARFNSDGFLGLGVTTPSERLHVVGNGLFTGEVTAYSSSDSRLKQNIKPITSALDIIEGLNPVSYNWNKKAIALNSIKDDIRTNYGVIAQEVEKILPDLVHQTNGYKSVDYIQMIGILLAGVRELNCRINNLENR
jgi:hypothetical protein